MMLGNNLSMLSIKKTYSWVMQVLTK